MSFFDSVRAWLSQRPPATEADQKLRLLLRASLEIVSAYGAVLEHGSSHKTPTIKLSDADLPFNKEQIALGALAAGPARNTFLKSYPA